MVTRFKDVDLKILKELDDYSLLNFCSTSRYAKYICSDENFWRTRFLEKFGKHEKSPNRTWKIFYIRVIYLTNRYTLEKVLNKTDSMDLVSFFISQGANNFQEGLNGAVERGDPEMAKFFISQGARDLRVPLEIAAKRGDMEMIKFLEREYKEEGGLTYDPNFGMVGAAIAGNFDLVKYFVSKEADDYFLLFITASRGGNIEIIKYAEERIPYPYPRFGMAGAARGGNKKLVKRFIRKGAKNWDDGLINATLAEDQEMINFFISKGARDFNRAMRYAIQAGNKEIIRFFASKGANDWWSFLRKAEDEGDKDIYRFLLKLKNGTGME